MRQISNIFRFEMSISIVKSISLAEASFEHTISRTHTKSLSDLTGGEGAFLCSKSVRFTVVEVGRRIEI